MSLCICESCGAELTNRRRVYLPAEGYELWIRLTRPGNAASFHEKRTADVCPACVEHLARKALRVTT